MNGSDVPPPALESLLNERELQPAFGCAQNSTERPAHTLSDHVRSSGICSASYLAPARGTLAGNRGPGP